jgi:hypothetical protein
MLLLLLSSALLVLSECDWGILMRQLRMPLPSSHLWHRGSVDAAERVLHEGIRGRCKVNRGGEV